MLNRIARLFRTAAGVSIGSPLGQIVPLISSSMAAPNHVVEAGRRDHGVQQLVQGESLDQGGGHAPRDDQPAEPPHGRGGLGGERTGPAGGSDNAPEQEQQASPHQPARQAGQRVQGALTDIGVAGTRLKGAVDVDRRAGAGGDSQTGSGPGTGPVITTDDMVLSTRHGRGLDEGQVDEAVRLTASWHGAPAVTSLTGNAAASAAPAAGAAAETAVDPCSAGAAGTPHFVSGGLTLTARDGGPWVGPQYLLPGSL
jgi:hypothetical protein